MLRGNCSRGCNNKILYANDAASLYTSLCNFFATFICYFIVASGFYFILRVPSADGCSSGAVCVCLLQCRRYAMEAHQTSAARSHLSLVCSLAVDQQRQIDDLSNRLAAVTTALASPDGSFLWRITGFNSKPAGHEVSLLTRRR